MPHCWHGRVVSSLAQVRDRIECLTDSPTLRDWACRADSLRSRLPPPAPIAETARVSPTLAQGGAHARPSHAPPLRKPPRDTP